MCVRSDNKLMFKTNTWNYYYLNHKQNEEKLLDDTEINDAFTKLNYCAVLCYPTISGVQVHLELYRIM